ncbi:hypothetical protein SapgrDRAFT_2525 [Saprospira grandis DSM 2844]|uniref:Uncharacterized protein n=1 Tax=Saprospira grandis DSM 2844 TaxID=694433 RepID=J0P327_9BACT|nr:hypothetical protein SapgrDRAFT_2525 [Saprospira grandis DSM 2844]
MNEGGNPHKIKPFKSSNFIGVQKILNSYYKKQKPLFCIEKRLYIFGLVIGIKKEPDLHGALNHLPLLRFRPGGVQWELLLPLGSMANIRSFCGITNFASFFLPIGPICGLGAAQPPGPQGHWPTAAEGWRKAPDRSPKG